MQADKKGARLRALAATAVDEVVSSGRSLDVALANAAVAADERPLLKMLCYGVIRHHWQLRWQISQLLDRPLKKRDKVIESLLAVGIFQLTDTRVPDHAAVSMTAEAARTLRRPKYTGLVNAVLRNFQRKDVAAQTPDDEQARWNHPQWLLDRLRADWPEDWQDIAAANNARAPMWLRVNHRRVSTADYLQGLDGSDGEHETLDAIPTALRLAKPVDVGALPGFADGLVSVQDAAAQLAAPWLLGAGADGKAPRILDACAAPGGKTGHLLELARAGAALTAMDSDADRLRLVEENLQRLQLAATVLCADASTPETWWDGVPFDGILLDAPCSATGVIRRHPDIRLLRRDSDIAALRRLQEGLLDALWPLVKPGGRLLYVTCSVLAEENERVVGDFLRRATDAEEQQMLPNNNIRDLMCRKRHGYQVLTGTAGLDGFYYACLDKHPAN